MKITLEERRARLLRRLAVEAPVSALPGPTGPGPGPGPGDGLLQPSKVLRQLGDRLKELLKALPFDTLPEDQRALLGKLLPGSGRFLQRLAAGLAFLGVPVAQVTPEQIRLLCSKARVTGKLWRIAARLKNRAMDARLLIGAFGWFLTDQVLLCLEQELAAAQGQGERDAILSAFGPALLELDRVLRQSGERKRKLEAERQGLAAQLQDAQEAAEAEWTAVELRHFPERPSRDALIAAARHYMKTRGEQPKSPALLSESTVVMAGTGPRVLQ